MKFINFLAEKTAETGVGVKAKYKIRFHLGEGVNKFKWRVENVVTKQVEFYAPKTVTLVLKNAKLHNRKTGAKKIHDGANKEVVSWVMADQVYVLKTKALSADIYGDRVAYNPAVVPFWHRKATKEEIEAGKTHAVPDEDTRGNKLANAGELVVDIDKTTYPQLITDGSGIYFLKPNALKQLEAEIEKDDSKVLYEHFDQLDEANSEAAAQEINYIDVDDDEDGKVIVTIEYTDRDIAKHKAEYYAEMLDIDLSKTKFRRGHLIVTVDDEDGKVAKQVKSFAKANDIECG